MRAYKACVGMILLLEAGSAAAEQSVLQWSPNQRVEPNISVEVQWFKDNDFLSEKKDGVGRLQPLSGVMDTFCGTDVALRKDFSKWASSYAFPGFLYHPKHAKPAAVTAPVSAYHSPYEVHQTFFLDWMHDRRGRDDFLLPAARKMNPYKGDLADPIVASRSDVTEEMLQKTFGYVAVAEQGKITFIGDNRYNPLRWICPVNEIHHREQPAWAMRLPVRPDLWPRTVELLQQQRKKIGEKTEKESGSERIVLRYEIALKIEDFREQMGEFTFRDYMESENPGEPDLVVQLYSNALHYASGASRDGIRLEPIQRKMVEKYVHTRLEPVNFQLGIGVNFKERDERYRLAEFMLCTYNQKTCIVAPEMSGGPGFLATACDELNPLVTDGGNNGAGAWWRVPISVLEHEALTKGDASSWSGSDYLELASPQMERTVFKGEIDITRFYHQALRAGFFPGQRGWWVNRWVGFEGDAPEYRNPDEPHGIEWPFFIFESHGPLRVEAEVLNLDVVITN